MNAMNMLGFTAEASLYKWTRLYRGYSGRARLDTASAVVAAAPPCFSHVQKCCGQLNPDGTCDGICWPKNLPCPATISECIDQLGNEGCYPSFDGTLIKICSCGSGPNCGPCFNLTVTVDTPFGLQTKDLGSRTICRCD